MGPALARRLLAQLGSVERVMTADTVALGTVRGIGPRKAARIREQEEARNFHGAGGAFELERSLPVVHARDLIQPLRDGLALLQTDPERFKRHNPKNGWGSYDGFVPWVAAYLAACERWPDAKVRVSR